MAQPDLPLLERRTVAVKVETLYGTDVFAGTVLAADVMEAYNIQPNVGPEPVDIPSMGGLLTNLGSVSGVRLAAVSFEMMPRGFGTAYSASNKPAVDVPLRACAMLATGTFGAGTEKWEYTPRSSSFEAVTIYIMQEFGPTVKLAGCFGNWELTCPMGRTGMFRFTFAGVYIQEADTPVLVTNVVSRTPPWPVFLSSAFTVGAYQPAVATVSVNNAQALEPDESMNAAGGITAILPGPRRMNATIDPRLVTRATFDWIADWEAGTTRALSWQTNGAQYARMKLSAPAARIRRRGMGQRGAKAVYQVAVDLLPVAGSDEFKISFD